MSAELSNLYGKKFATTVQLLLQQKGSRLRGTVTEGSYAGEMASPVDQIGAVEMNPVVDRFAPIVRTDAAVARRWIAPQSFDLAQLVDSFDELKIISDPKSKYVQNGVQAAGRMMDRVILAAAHAAAITGKDGTGSTNFDSNYSVAVNFGSAGNSGLTVAKLRQLKMLAMANEIDLDNDQLYLAVTAKQHDNLLAEAQVISLDFNEKPVLKEGLIERFLGINFVRTELIPFSTYRVNPMWAKSGMHLGMWGGEWKTDISQRKDLKGLPWQAYLYMTIGATRVEEKKVFRVYCAE